MTNTSYIIPSTDVSSPYYGRESLNLVSMGIGMGHHHHHHNGHYNTHHRNYYNNDHHNNHHNNSNNTINLSFGLNSVVTHKLGVSKIPDLLSNGGDADDPLPVQPTVVGFRNRRMRHDSQQQSPSVIGYDCDANYLNKVNHRSSVKDLTMVKKSHEIDVSVPITIYEPDQHASYLAKTLELTLKHAKESKKLMCTEILIPQMLTLQIAEDMIAMAEAEPCGIRGCILYINIEEKTVCRRLGEVQLGDHSTVATFEVYLTLKRASSSWIDAVENKLFGKESVILSELYRLSKKKLYRSLSSP